MKNQQIAILSVAAVAIVGIISGLTYALWSSTSTQTGDNVINSGCFEITFTDQEGSDINLVKAFPVTDADGMTTSPYNFTIENTCDLAAKYGVTLEVEPNDTNALPHKYLKVVLDNNTPKILTDYTVATATLAGRSAYQLDSSTLYPGETKSYDFRMWLTEDAPQSEAQNKSLSAKIVITSTPVVEKTSLTGIVSSYNPTNPTTIELQQNGVVKYSTNIDATTGSGIQEQRFTIDDVEAGSYNLVVKKTGNLTYTVSNVTVSGRTLDLSTATDKSYSKISLIAGDVNGDNIIDDTDAASPIDLNGDGAVDTSDSDIIAANLNQTTANCTYNY